MTQHFPPPSSCPPPSLFPSSGKVNSANAAKSGQSDLKVLPELKPELIKTSGQQDVTDDGAKLDRTDASLRTSAGSRGIWINVILFLVTAASVLYAGSDGIRLEDGTLSIARVVTGWKFAVPLMAILLAHEFGHYIAARVHHVRASLPFFIPMPISPFGTMGAIISMKGRIRSRKALLDIGAAGPLAGMVLAVPIVGWGLALSEVKPISGQGLMEGQCLLYLFLKWIVLGPVPSGSDVFLHPTAFAGWVGFLITMINLVPVGQLDGGHVAYALVGPIQDRIAKIVHYSLLGVFAINFAYHLLGKTASATWSEAVSTALEMSSFWLVWFGFLFILRKFSGAKHPPTEPESLDTKRVAIAVITLLLFVVLFMPTPLHQYDVR